MILKTVGIVNDRPTDYFDRHFTSSLHCVSKNAPILASCSFGKQELILIIFGKRHQHIFRNDIRVQLSLSRHFYLRHLLLNKAAMEMTRSDVTQCS